MSIYHRFNVFRINMAFTARPVWIMIGLALIAAPVTAFAQNMDCTLIVPANPLTAAGLATPYQLVATNPANGPCRETDANQSAFVQAAVIDLNTGQISIYNPLVIDRGTSPAAAPVVPTLPKRSVVALWFGFNGNNLSLVGQNDGSQSGENNDLEDNHCTQGLGQFAYCNAVAFFEAADDAIDDGKLQVPPLGTSPKDHLVCPSVRSFTLVDQDQSDNLTTTYLFTPNGIAQDTATNRAKFGVTGRKGNPSDNRLMNVFVDPALGCTSWRAPDLTDPGFSVPSLSLNELQAAMFQKAPIARIPLGDPFVLDPPFTGKPSLAQVNRYRRGVHQQLAEEEEDASTTTYCSNIREIHTDKLFLDRPYLTAFRSPFPDIANSLFTFMAQRYVASYAILQCQALLKQPVNVKLIFTGTVVTDAVPQ
jgi:hypothetical protein